MKYNFIPYPDKCVVEPLEAEHLLEGDDKRYMSKAKVLSVGSDCSFLKKGDIVFYEPYGQLETTKDEDGNQHFVIAEKSQFILGKYSNKDTKKYGYRKERM